MPEKKLGKEIKGTYRGKFVIKLLGEWVYFDDKGRGHKVERKYHKKIKPIEKKRVNEHQ